MKILIVSMWEISKDCIGGTERYVIDLAEFLKKEGIDVEVLMLSGKRRTISGVAYIPIKGSRIKVNEYVIKNTFFPEFTEANLKKFAKFVEQHSNVAKYDLIHMNSLLFYYLFARKKRIFALHENPVDFDNYWGKGSFQKMRELILADKKRSMNFVAPSKGHGSELESLFSSKVKIIPHAVNKKRFTCRQSKREILKKYHLGQKFTFLIPSRLEIVQKGQDIAAEALGMIKNKIPDFQVVFSGLDDQYTDNVRVIRAICDRYSIENYFVKFSDIKEAYKIADIIVVPSRSEIFGYSALESLAMSKKTVLSNIPTFLDFAKLTPLAFTSSLNAECFADKIVDAVNSKEISQSKRWLKEYDPRIWADKYIEFYEEILQK